jgi:hypothetical protein
VRRFFIAVKKLKRRKTSLLTEARSIAPRSVSERILQWFLFAPSALFCG